MPANHCKPHTEEAKAKMRVSHTGVPATWKHRPQKIVDGVQLFRCGRCKDFFPRDGFYANKRTLLGLSSECKSCHSAVNLSSRNVVTARARQVGYENARRARIAGSPGKCSNADWAALLEILGRNCLKCGSPEKPTRDHIVPLARGGIHHPTNMQPLCRKCNEKKQAKTVDYRTDQQRETIASRWVVEVKRVKP
jgi:5-methylcytosine-specific restriction endonuclease McrA